MVLTRSSSAAPARPSRATPHVRDSAKVEVTTRARAGLLNRHEQQQQRPASPLFGASPFVAADGGAAADSLAELDALVASSQQWDTCTANGLNEFLAEDLFNFGTDNSAIHVNPRQQQQSFTPNPGPPLIPLDTRPKPTAAPTLGQPLSFPDINSSTSFSEPQARAFQLDASLQSPLFDASPRGGGGELDAFNFVAPDFSPAWSDVSPQLCEGSASPEVGMLDLSFANASLFGGAGSSSVAPPVANQQAVLPPPSPVYSPVIPATQLGDIQISPSTMLPPALASAPTPTPLILPALPAPVPAEDSTPEEAEDDARDADYNPRSSSAGPTRTTPRRTTTSTYLTRDRVRKATSPSPLPAKVPGVGVQRLALDAPIQKRKYTVDSRTSEKKVPKSLQRRIERARKRGEEVPTEEEAAAEAARRREQNTRAARESRAKKAQAFEDLKMRVGELEGALDERDEVIRVQGEEIRELKRRLAECEAGDAGTGVRKRVKYEE
ncbi:transcription factor [Rhodotorula toruloides]|uniref:Transcription factor n=1 Tax=Rhodotorula toruloides TaxID=5286 RepID=A0A511KRC9_RHOTO|nr:transcription factor [Rhodotorula toruloides]